MQNQHIGNLPYHQGFTKILEYYRTLRARDLTSADILFLRRVGVINGCGGNPRNSRVGVFGRLFAWIASGLARCLAPAFVTASCELHDFGYWKGGDEKRRAECDKRFYEAILRDIEYIKTPRNQHILRIKKGCYRVLAKCFYIAVRVGGKAYFNYL